MTQHDNELKVNEMFREKALEKFSGGDSGAEAAGSPENRSIWCFGIEHGTFRSSNDENEHTRAKADAFDDSYSVDQQLTFPYNQKLFALLAAIDGKDPKKYEEFARDRQPFVRNRGPHKYFKGNLYPYGFRTVHDYTDQAREEIGLAAKEDYYAWCDKHRLPVIRSWVEEHQPEIFIGFGISCRDQFAKAVFAGDVALTKKVITINKHSKTLFSHTEGWKKLVVVPHFSGPHGLNSYDAIRLTGEYIAEVINAP